MRRGNVKHSRVKQGAREGQERTGAGSGPGCKEKYSRFYARTENIRYLVWTSVLLLTKNDKVSLAKR